MTCANCGRTLSNGNYVNGLVLCGTCVLLMDENEQLPRAKRLEPDWKRFTRQKRRTQAWR